MAQKKLLTNGKAFKRTDDRWGGTVWYMDEKGERKRKSFSGTTKAKVNKKMTDYVAAFNDALQESDESRKTLKESMTHWLQVFKFPSVERTTYDRCECTVEHQIFPLLGEKVVNGRPLFPFPPAAPLEAVAICELGAVVESNRLEYPREVCAETPLESIQRPDDALCSAVRDFYNNLVPGSPLG